MLNPPDLEAMTVFFESPTPASRWCENQRENGLKIGYVPTMGALHHGHLSLVEQSVKDNDRTCVSIFVNPLQFDNPKDLKNYPSEIEKDMALLRAKRCDMLYTGTIEDFFPEGVRPHEPMSSAGNHQYPMMQGLEAEYRPGHLQGVKAIVEKLFLTVGECQAYFGEKDFQQTLLVKQIAREHSKDHGRIVVNVCPTIRESSGLAMSSRNRRLSGHGMALATIIYAALRAAKTAWSQHIREATGLESIMADALIRPGVTMEYATVRDPYHWTVDAPCGSLKNAQALVAAYIEGIRLIDNMRLDSDSPGDTHYMK